MKTRSVAQKTFSSPEPKPKCGRAKKDRTHESDRTRSTSLTLKRVASITPKAKTPRQNKRRDVVTPLRDDLIFSQHFDSQVEVGWDCNSPNAVRGLQKISGSNEAGVSDLVMQLIRDEPDELPDTKRSTPPLLGIWKDNQGEDHLAESEEPVQQQRFKKRGRTRRKSGKESAVSLDLLQKLTSVLGQNSDNDPISKNSETDLKIPDIDEVEEEEDEDEVFNVSGDLFPASKHDKLQEKVSVSHDKEKVVDKDHGRVEVKGKEYAEIKQDDGNEEEEEDLWEDDDLFENSYIIKATQIPADSSVKWCSPVFGLKRKLSSESVIPKSKCTRYTFKLGEDNDSGLDSPSVSENISSHNSSVSGGKRSVMYSAGKNTDKVNTNFTTLHKRNSNQSQAVSTVSSNPPAGPIVKSHVKQTVPSAKSSCAFNTSIQDRSCTRSSTITSASTYQKQPMHGSIAKTLTSKASATFTGHVSSNLGASANTELCSNTTRQSTLSRSGSFKKHSSFPGPDKSESTAVSTYSRQRSMSGTLNRQSPRQGSWNSPTSSAVGHTVSCSVDTSAVESTRSVISGSTTVISSQFYGNAARTNQKHKHVPVTHHILTTVPSIPVTSVLRSRSTVASVTTTAVTSTFTSKPRTSIGSAFDTSLSDELLFQLAEPDDMLDSNKVTTSVASSTVSAITSKSKPQLTSADAKRSNQNLAKKETSAVTDKVVTSRTFKFKDSHKESLHDSSNKNKPKSVDTQASKVSLPSSKVVEKQTVRGRVPDLRAHSEDLFPSDDDDDLLGDGLTEPEILAMLDEAEFLATQQLRSSQNATTTEEKVKPVGECHPEHSDSSQPGSRPGSQPHKGPSEDKWTCSQGSHGGSQGHSSQNIADSQGQATQVKYSQADIERKKREALERRKKKMKL